METIEQPHLVLFERETLAPNAPTRTPRTIPHSADEPLTIISAGMGQESNAFIYRIGLDPAFRAKWIRGECIAIFSATGDEHDDTDEYVPIMEKFCGEHDIQFEHLTLDRGYHSPSASRGLVGKQRKDVAIGTVGFKQSCTQEFKLTPIYNFAAEYCANIYGGEARAKKSLYRYREAHGLLRVIIGFAAGEESRVEKAKNKTCAECHGHGVVMFAGKCKACRGTGIAKPRSMWAECVETVFPLAEIGWDRQACQDYILSIHKPLPPPSLCFRCMWKDADEILWSALAHPVRFEEWCIDEEAKLAKYAYLGPAKNYGVKGANTTLRQIAANRLAFYEAMNWTTDRILAHLSHHRMSHGHCVKSKWS